MKVAAGKPITLRKVILVMDEENFSDSALEEVAPDDEFQEVAKELRSRCAKASIPVDERKSFDGSPILRVMMPSGRDKREISLWRSILIRQFLSIEFEQFSFLGKYLAICSYTAGTIEAGIRSYTTGALRRLSTATSSQIIDLDDEEDGAINLVVSHPSTPVRMMISPPSQAFQVLRGTPGLTRLGTLKIEGLRIEQHDQALQLLERLANTFFFQIDLSKDAALGLLTDRRLLRRVMRRRSNYSKTELEFPRTEIRSSPNGSLLVCTWGHGHAIAAISRLLSIHRILFSCLFAGGGPQAYS